MHFKKLDLIGFKSFPVKTTLNFEPGITAIVGPNGCGKSNIFDAIRWVLGEQSIKALRGAKMEDVIFNGTDNKEPLSLAEVSLTLSNENKSFNIEDKEFVITRKIYRSGESEYLLNKSQVRLKDISDLLIGTGVGAEAYSLVEQGKIDLILSSRPEDRRLVFDEAAGITKYKSQKREALRRLQDTGANLLRINDIITEVKRQIGSLERQANKARRYKEVFEELKKNEIDLALFEINVMAKENRQFCEREKACETQLKITQEECAEVLSRQEMKTKELEDLQEKISKIKEEILNFDNLKERNLQHIRLNQERILELQKVKDSLDSKIEQARKKLESDRGKIEAFQKEYQGLRNIIQANKKSQKAKEEELDSIFNFIKGAHEKINQTKKDIFEIINEQTRLKNDLIDLNVRLQGFSAREKRLEIEKLKVQEEKTNITEMLESVNEELESAQSNFNEKKELCENTQNKIESQTRELKDLNAGIQSLEKEKISLISQKEFLENLKLKYEQISESMQAVILLDTKPRKNLSGVVIKVKAHMQPEEKDKAFFKPAVYKLFGEAKPIELDSKEISQKIQELEKSMNLEKDLASKKEQEIKELESKLKEFLEEARQKEIILANKRSQFENINAQLNKLNEELEIVEIELSEVHTELKNLREKEKGLVLRQGDLEKRHKEKENFIAENQGQITDYNMRREENLISIAKIKTELESLNKRLLREEETLGILEAGLKVDEEDLDDSSRQIASSEEKITVLNEQIQSLEKNNQGISENKEIMLKTQNTLKGNLCQMQKDLGQDHNSLESQRQEIQELKDALNKAQIKIQELNFKILNIKERIMQGYKVELDQDTAISEDFNFAQASEVIQELRHKIDSYGTVNLVAIEEYDELKARYDFLTQQQNDLLSAKNSLHEAITKINRTTRKMFLDTFKAILEEFRNYYRLLFGGGDANLFLIDENDPLESGIEIICRPPGKKLQNVSLLSGGEKSLSAIALIFAIFKIKPSPFCVLDEVDAALDEANVDRYSRMLQDFAKASQFIVITHNKRTIANANVMYGITMEQSGVSKIVSVKFSQNKPLPVEREEAVAAA